LRAYPVQERHGAIFVYFGQAEDEVPPPLGLPPELGSPAHTGMLCYANWKCNYRYAIDNLMDLMHGAYLHAASHSMARGDKSADMRLRRTETGLMFEKVGQRDLNFDWVEFGDTGTLWMRTAVPYQEKFGGGVFYIAGLTTPVDADNCVVFFWRIREASDWQADLWRFLYRARLEGLHWDVLEQDRVVLEQLVPNARRQEFLYQHDTCLARVRRLMEEKARAQVA
jgi:phenylpropionate dioxygenase-like ring-hydroxylating dioxygenase large terminal subunit